MEVIEAGADCDVEETVPCLSVPFSTPFLRARYLKAYSDLPKFPSWFQIGVVNHGAASPPAACPTRQHFAKAASAHLVTELAPWFMFDVSTSSVQQLFDISSRRHCSPSTDRRCRELLSLAITFPRPCHPIRLGGDGYNKSRARNQYRECIPNRQMSPSSRPRGFKQ